MSALISEGQPLRRTVLSPASTYSRVVSCSENVTFGNPRGFYTVGVADRVWLLSVRLFWRANPPDHLAATYFRVMTGTEEPVDSDDMRQHWESVLPNMGAGHLDTNWVHEYGVLHMEWTMRKLYVGVGRMFGVWMHIIMPGDANHCQASFEISEG